MSTKEDESRVSDDDKVLNLLPEWLKLQFEDGVPQKFIDILENVIESKRPLDSNEDYFIDSDTDKVKDGYINAALDEYRDTSTTFPPKFPVTATRTPSSSEVTTATGTTPPPPVTETKDKNSWMTRLSQWGSMALTGVTALMYIGVLIYFVIVAIRIANQSSYMTPFIIVFGVLWALYGMYRYLHGSNGGQGRLEDIAFLVVCFLFITLFWALTTDLTGNNFKWITILVMGILCLVLLPPILYRLLHRPGQESSSLQWRDIYWNFFTSYSFLFTMIIVALLVLYTNVKRFTVPYLATLQMWATIASIVFGIKYLLLYRFKYSNTMTIFAFLALISFLVFLLIQPSGISQTLLTVVFSLACILLAVMLPNNIPYLLQGFFMVSIFMAAGLGMFTQTFSSSTVSFLFWICALYLLVHSINTLNQSIEVTSLTKAFTMYSIILVVVLILYFTDEGNPNKFSTQWGPIFPMIFLPLFLYGGLQYWFYSKGNNNSAPLLSKGPPLPEGIWVGTFLTLVGLLLISIYLLSITYNTHINYSIVGMMLMYMVGSLMFMLYNLKDGLHLFWFLLYLLLPVGFVSLFQYSGNSGAIAGGVVLLLIWCVVNLLFWKSSSLTLDSLLSKDSVLFSISGLIVYLIFYYVYVTFSSKKSVSQQFSQIVLIFMFSYLLLQIFKTSKIASNPFVSLLIQCIEYIPCLIDDVITRILKIPPDEKWKEDFSYHSLGTKILAGVVLCVVGYYVYPKIKSLYIKHTNIHAAGISLIGETPVSTQGGNLIQTYEQLTSSTSEPIYNYGISFEVYINPAGGNDTFYPVVDFTGNLLVTYNTQQNQLYIYAVKDDEEHTHVTLYRYIQFPLQTWVKIEINYVSGIYDVFVENKLKTSHSVVSYNSHENVYVGSNGSAVVGQVKNFMYYPKPFSVADPPRASGKK